MLRANLEAEYGAEGEPQVIVGAMVEVSLVAEFEAQPYRTETCFHSCGWIDCRV